MISIIMLLHTAVILFLYFFIVKPKNYWSKRNVTTNKFMPFFGDYYRILLGKESFGEMVIRSYNEAQNVRYFGSYQFQMPALMLKSPELIKEICVKKFDHFVNRRSVLADGVDVLWTKNLVALKGNHWKNMRSLLSPAFTSRKMKAMFTHINQHAKLFTHHFLKMEEEIIDVEFKDAFSRYTIDVIASTSFGLQVNSLKDRDNEFYVMGIDASVLTNTWGLFIFMIYQMYPAFAKFFHLRFFEEKIQLFFLTLVKDTMKMREKLDDTRSDMLGLLMEARKGKNTEGRAETNEQNLETLENVPEMRGMGQELSDIDITAQVFIFFLGGFETLSSSLCFMAYELAVNPDIQKKLIEEIDKNTMENDEPSYQMIYSLTYLDMVVSESLRKWPPNIITDRVVTKPYTIQPKLPGEEPLTLKIGEYISIPLLAFHHDPKYFENPHEFNPERFSPENRRNIDPYAYFPFGVGPRNCIASRFALLEIKAVFFHLLGHFEIVPIPETDIPMKLCRTAINLKPVNGYRLGLKRREKHSWNFDS